MLLDLNLTFVPSSPDVGRLTGVVQSRRFGLVGAAFIRAGAGEFMPRIACLDMGGDGSAQRIARGFSRDLA
jgi:hypothetical protein